MRANRWPALSWVLLLGISSVSGDDLQNAPDDANVTVSGEVPTGKPAVGVPEGAQPVAFRIILSQSSGSSGGTVGPTPTELEPRPAVAVRDQQQITSESDYDRLVGAPSDGIDWTQSRVVVVRLTTTFKLGRLESDEQLSGIYESGDAILVLLTFTHHGPCQGIAQKAEWFSRDWRDLFVVLPATPKRLTFVSRVVGGCPPDIP